MISVAIPMPAISIFSGDARATSSSVSGMTGSGSRSIPSGWSAAGSSGRRRRAGRCRSARRSSATVIAAMEANHPNLTTQKTLYVEISRERGRAELVTDDKAALRETLEAVTGERIAALEAVEPERAKDRAAGLDADRSTGRGGGASESRQPERRSEPEMEKAYTPKSLDRELGL